MNSRTRNARARRLPRRAGIGGLLAIAALVPVGTASAAVTNSCDATTTPGTVACEFWAKAGQYTPPGAANPVDVLGYATSAGGPPVLPGPTIVATAGDTVTVLLHNALANDATSMLFQEQPMAADLAGVGPGLTTTYSFTADTPGTYIYEASPLMGRAYQTAMGMQGVLVVRPRDAAQAYDAGSAFDAEHLVVLTDLDRSLTAANAKTFDMRDFAPQYHLVNGKAAPSADNLDVTTTPAGAKVLLRYVNAAVSAHAVAVLGLAQTVVGEDGNRLANPRAVVSETLGAGQTEDVILAVPATASGRYPIYDSGLALNNEAAPGMGGMITFLNVSGAAPGPDAAGPGTRNVAFAAGTLTASVSDVDTGGSNIAAAEYFVDSVGAPGSGTPMAVSSTTTPTATATATGVVVPAGSHVIYVRGQDGAGNWGPVSSVFPPPVDGTGPTVKNAGASPNPANPAVKAIAITATADDRATGGSNIASGYYTVDGDAAKHPMTLTGSGPLVELTASLDATSGLAEGLHTLHISAVDSANNASPAPADLRIVVDTTGPAGGNPTLAPTPNNGAVPFSATVQAVRVGGDFTDPAPKDTIAPPAAGADPVSGVAAGEGFIDPANPVSLPNGTGFPLVPKDGAFGGVSETLLADIPLSKVATLADGSHTIVLHAQDGSGNWGPAISATLTVDKTKPVVSNVAATPASVTTTADPNVPPTTFRLSANAADPTVNGVATGVAALEWFSGADPGPGKGNPMTLNAGSYQATIDWVAQGWGNGPRTISVRARDGAGNWSALGTVTFTVNDVIFANGFEPNAAGWNTAPTGAGRLSFPPNSNLAGVGTHAMNVNLAGTMGAANPASAYVTDTRPTPEPIYKARFYINPFNSTPGAAGTSVTILGGYSSTGANLFAVRYRLNAGLRQLQLGVGTASTPWVTVAANAASSVEIAWQTASTSAQLRVNGAVTNLALPAATPATGVKSVRLGVQGLAGASATRAGSVRLDAFESHRRTLVGP